MKGSVGAAMKIAGLVAVVLALASQPAAVAATPAKVSFRHIVSGSQTANPAAAQLTYAADEQSFEKIWRTINGKSDFPPIDFKTEGAIVITAGEKPTSGYSIKVDSITNDKGTLVVDGRIAAPPAGAMTAQVMTSPYLVIAVSKKAGVSAARWKTPSKAAPAKEVNRPLRQTLLRERLDALVATFDISTIEPDPLQLVLRYTDSYDQEVAALIAAAFAYGRADIVVRNAGTVLEKMGTSPYAYLKTFDAGGVDALRRFRSSFS